MLLTTALNRGLEPGSPERPARGRLTHLKSKPVSTYLVAIQSIFLGESRMSLLVTQPKHGRTGTSSDHLTDLPRLTTTVPREYVHRASLAEVFLTSCEKVGENRFTLTGQWPRAHTFFNRPDGRQHDPLLFAETARQIGLYLAHTEFGVPLGHPFIMWDLSWDVDPQRLAIGATPSDLLLDVTYSSQAGGNRNASKGPFEVKVDLWRGDRLVGSGTEHFTLVSPAAYHRLRGQLPAVPADPSAEARTARVRPADVGRAHPNDVVLAASDQAGRWLLACDRQHPIMFDHQADHIPGMVLLEAARQASCALLAPQADLLIPSQVSSEFHRYVEFGSPCWIEATPLPGQDAGRAGFLVTAEQDGRTVFSAQVCGRLAQR